MTSRKTDVPTESGGKCGVVHKQLATTLEHLNNMRKEGTLCDVVLVVQGQHFTAHRPVLAAASKFFSLMFTSSMIESTSREVELGDTESAALEQLLEFIYTTRITINSSNVVSLVNASNQYQIEPVKEMCVGFLKEQVDATNCLGIFALADYMGCQELKDVAEHFLLLHFTDLYKQDEFLKLHLTQITHLLHQDKLFVQSEEQIYYAAMRWLKYDICNRKQHVAEVLGCVRFSLVSTTFLSTTVRAEPLIKENQQCQNMLNNGTLDPLASDCCLQNSDKKNQPRRKSVIVVIGGPLSMTTYYFNPKDCTWAEIHRSSVKSGDLSTAVLCDNMVYIVGGKKSYNVMRKEWQLQTPWPRKRDFVAACASEGKIYTSGGAVCKLSMAMFESYDTKTKSWHIQPMMRTARHGHGSVEAHGLIYVCGGTRGNRVKNNILNNCEVFDTSTLQWREICSMNKARVHHGLVVVGNRIYALGGEGVKGAMDSVEYYEIDGNKWHCAAPMPVKGVRLKCATVGRIIYVLAGRVFQKGPTYTHTSVESYLKYVLEYHTYSDRWVIRCRTQAFPCSNLSCCVACDVNVVTNEMHKCFKTFQSELVQ